MPPASKGSPLHKGRSEEPTTNIADFCNKIGTTLTSREVRYSSAYEGEADMPDIPGDFF